mmetsp:Transcript_33974/g.44843  ORF Transcript_33974/g.44843 Transcript_33974/m.44843 type:complete len:81 (-) Transcript_33974:19-261(-)
MAPSLIFLPPQPQRSIFGDDRSSFIITVPHKEHILAILRIVILNLALAISLLLHKNVHKYECPCLVNNLDYLTKFHEMDS